jgi:hypothetical protein
VQRLAHLLWALLSLISARWWLSCLMNTPVVQHTHYKEALGCGAGVQGAEETETIL